MSRISYDQVKDRFAGVIRRSTIIRRLFYLMLDLLFLRSWYIRRLLRIYGDKRDHKAWTLLDAGCGFGQYDRFILDRFKSVLVTAVDVKDSYLKDCRSFFSGTGRGERVRFERVDLLTFDHKESFDMILCVDVLEHIEEDRKVLENLRGSLKPGGVILIHSPSHLSEEDADEGESSFVDEHARSGYSRSELSEKLLTAGLKPLETNYTYGRWGHLSWVWVVKWPMMLLNKAGMAGGLLLLPYYLVILPIGLLLNRIDMIGVNRKGTGIYAVGRRPE
ncbi:MAG: class I SAM-dependent methyltransferase [Balneolaceae bacterium]